MSGERDVPLDDDERDAIVASLLRAHPCAVVAAVDSYGRLVEVPSTIEVAGQHVIRAGSPFQLVAPAARAAIIANRARVVSVGAASTRVVLVDGSNGWCHAIDLRRRHGVVLGISVSDTTVDLASELSVPVPMAPRTGRMERDETGTILSVDADICTVLGRDADDLVGMRTVDLVHPDDHVRAIDAWMEMLLTPGMTTRVRTRHRRGDGSWLWIEVTNINRLEDAEGRVISQLVDVSDEIDALEALRRREQVLRRLAEALPSGVLHVDRHRNVVYSNARLRAMVGGEEADTVPEQLSAVIPEDRQILAAAIDSALADGSDARVEVRLRMPNSSRLHLCAFAICALTDAAGDPDGAVLCIDDVTEAAQLRAELERRASVDELTGCLNRASVLAELARVLRRHVAGSPGTAVVYLDLDGFKDINDTHGHHAGDHLLVSVVTRLTGVLRKHDVIGRLGGDEFLIVLPAVDDLEEAQNIGRRLERSLDHPLELVGGHPVHIRCSIGVALTSEPDVGADTLIAAADHAMYASKRNGAAQPVYVQV